MPLAYKSQGLLQSSWFKPLSLQIQSLVLREGK